MCFKLLISWIIRFTARCCRRSGWRIKKSRMMMFVAGNCCFGRPCLVQLFACSSFYCLRAHTWACRNRYQLVCCAFITLSYSIYRIFVAFWCFGYCFSHIFWNAFKYYYRKFLSNDFWNSTYVTNRYWTGYIKHWNSSIM